MLRRKVLTKILLIEGAILASFIIAFSVIFKNYEKLEQNDLQKNLIRVQSAIKREMDSVNRYNYLWASQGAIYYTIRDDEPMTIAMRNMLINSIVGGFDIDSAAIFDNQEKLIGARELNPDAFIDKPIDHNHPIVKLFVDKGLVKEDNLPAQGLVEFNDSLALVNAQIIRNPFEPGKFYGSLVVTRKFNQEVIDYIVEVVQQDADILFLKDFVSQDIGPALLEQMQSVSNNTIYSPIDKQTMGTYVLTPDITGEKSLVLVLRTPRAIILQAKQTIVNTGLALLLFFLFRVLYVLFFLDRSILLRLKTLSGDIHQLTLIEEMGQRLTVTGADEISDLTSSFNGLLDALENSQITLRNERDKAEITLDSIGDAVITTDLAGKITYMNKAALDILPDRNNQYQHQSLEFVFCPTDESGLSDEKNLAQRCIEAGESIRENSYCNLTNGQGESIIIETLACPIYDYVSGDDKGSLKGVVIVFRDVSHAKRLQQNLIYQASHDSLTNLYNRNEFERQLSIVAKSAHKNNQNHHLIFIDLDRFKVVNDICGHIAGDKVLREISQLMQSLVRKSDILARIGGDEFAIILMDCKFPRAYEVAEKIREAIANFRFISHDKCFSFGASVGFVNLKDQTFNDDTDLLSMADKACMAAKNSGRNRIHVFRSEDSQVAKHHEQTLWVNRITDALEHDHFELYFQRIAPSNTNNKNYSAEILLRMVGPDNAIIAPGAFLPAAERYGLMKFIDKWVVENFCAWAHKNQSIFKEFHTFSINLSGQSLSDAEFLNYLIDYFATPLVSPKNICFEITETSAIQNIANARKFINRLKEMGFSFSLDDFGSGMSSFSYLKHLAVDSLKIDGAFIKNIEKEAIDHSMVRSINEIGHIMGIKTVAEFVESEAICTMVRELGVDFLQGYHIHKPAPLSTLATNQKKLSGF